MEKVTQNSNPYVDRTRQAFIWTYVLNAPFWAMYTMLPFIMYKDLGASPWQITLVIALKPAVSLFSLYWSNHVNERKDRLIPNIIWAGVLGHLPFFIVPWMENAWLFVVASAVYMLLSRGVVPAWTEVLKLNLSETMRHKVFAYSSTLSYMGLALFPSLFGWVLDDYPDAWRWILSATALLSLSAIFFQSRIPIAASAREDKGSSKQTFRSHVVTPWKNVWELIKSRPDFLRFQIGFMLGGAGLMVIQPALPGFFMGTLQLSYKELAIAVAVCKGIGFALTSRLWAHWMDRMNIFRLCSLVTFLAALFPIFLLGVQWHHFWLYFSYVIYGVMQGGSELSWRLSGPIFSRDKDSSLYSTVNVLTVGIRGCIAPFIGSLFVFYFSAPAVLLLGCFFSLLATYQLTYASPRFSEVMSK